MRPSTQRILFLSLALVFLAVGTACGSDKSTNQGKTGLAFDTTHVTLGNVGQDSKGAVTFLAINYGALPIKAALGIEVAGMPVEELLFAAGFGIYWSGVYEHFTWHYVRLIGRGKTLASGGLRGCMKKMREMLIVILSARLAWNMGSTSI